MLALKSSIAFTAGGMALVVYVFATVLMMSEGIRSTLVATGQPDNVMVLRKGAGAEINSGIERDKAHLLSTLPGVATDAIAANKKARIIKRLRMALILKYLLDLISGKNHSKDEVTKEKLIVDKSIH